MRLYIILFLFIASIQLRAQNCDSVMIIHHVVNSDGDIGDLGIEIDTIRNGVIINRTQNGVLLERNHYDSLNRKTSTYNNLLHDSTVYFYDQQSNLYQRDYFYDTGFGFDYRSDTARSVNYYNANGDDSLFVRYTWNGSSFIPFNRRVFYYSTNVLIKWEAQIDTGGGYVIDSTFLVSWSGGFRVDSAFVGTNTSSSNFQIIVYDALGRITSIEDYYSMYLDYYQNFIYSCNDLMSYQSSCYGCHSGYSYGTTYDSLCRRKFVSYGHYSMSSSTTNIDYYDYAGCNEMAIVESGDSTICFGDSTTMFANVYGGTLPYLIMWSPSAGLSSFNSPTPKASPDSTRSYVVTVIDSAGRVATDTVVIIVKTRPHTNIQVINFDSTSLCQSAYLTTDSAADLQFYWQLNLINVGFGATIPIYFNGTYHLTVVSTNWNNVCPSAEDSITINSFTHSPPVATLSRGCGYMIANGPPGSHFRWFKNGNYIPGVTDDSLQILVDGTYSVNAIDVNGCISQEVSQYYHEPVFNTYSTNSCGSSCDGEISIASGFTSILWSTGDTLSYIDQLCPGIYSAVLIDNNYCPHYLQDTVNVYPPVPYHFITIPASSPTACDGKVILVDSLNSPYRFNRTWEDGSNEIFKDSVCSGWYSVNFTDATTQCPYIDSVFIGSSPVADTCSAIFNIVSPKCFGNTNGSATVYSSTGNHLTCFWLDPNIYSPYNPIQNYLGAGSYSCVLIDSNGCVDTGTAVITSPAALSATNSVYQSTCGDSCLVNLNVTGGSPPYYYQWCNGNFTSYLNDCISYCTVTIRDSNNCTLNTSVTQTAVNPLVLNVISQPSTCQTCPDASVFIDASGGLAPYTYTLDSINVGSNDTIQNVLPGPHIVCVNGNNGCIHCINIFIYSMIGIDEIISEKNIIIYPNPVTDISTVRIESIIKEGNYEIIDNVGRVISSDEFKGNEFTINSNGFSKGIYSLLIKSGNNIIGRKLFVLQ